jgi:hypothetical protein
MKALSLKMEHQFDEKWDPDTNSIENLNPDPHLSDAPPEPW